ncbi:hypothetical protein [Dermacoccus barathri]|uniref:Uncharacterized protein n=1 Tax=Dermacoccus abyssi TaxID=322596 RepID=A0ABX5ZE10_9MICO|nr:hypothetical protein [Dermacoccus barathri]MBE7372918.1 hypothetical protein [Dermacoccus barathri]QEH94818.1 hypothetical protein FV141_14440 [Dermacoccus abyssi]
MSTVTASDIRTHVIEPTCGEHFTAEELDAIEDAVLDAAPLSTWHLAGTQYTSSVLSVDEFWGVVEKTTV